MWHSLTHHCIRLEAPQTGCPGAYTSLFFAKMRNLIVYIGKSLGYQNFVVGYLFDSFLHIFGSLSLHDFAVLGIFTHGFCIIRAHFNQRLGYGFATRVLYGVQGCLCFAIMSLEIEICVFHKSCACGRSVSVY